MSAEGKVPMLKCFKNPTELKVRPITKVTNETNPERNGGGRSD